MRARWLVALLVAAAALLAAATPGAAADALDVHIPGTFFSPSAISVVAGDTVTWTNDTFTTHTVTADDGSFDSGRLGSGGRFTQTFATPGRYRYYCAIHPFMSGEVDVDAIALHGPGSAVLEGGSAPLAGRAPAGTPWVTIEQQRAGGAWSPVTSVQPDAGGVFSARVPAVSGVAYRAAVGTATSPTVTLSLVSGVRLRLTATVGRRATVLRVHTTPAQPGARVVLQLYSREHFAWQPRAVARLDRRSTVRFTLPRGVRQLARAVLPLGGARSVSAIVRTWRPRDPHAGPPAAPPAAA